MAGRRGGSCGVADAALLEPRVRSGNGRSWAARRGPRAPRRPTVSQRRSRRGQQQRGGGAPRAQHARRRKRVVVSRGQLVEIGGSFRIPDVMTKSQSLLREVGTTNRTRVADFEAAIGPNTGVLLSVHPSNYRVVGFTEEAELSELVRPRTPALPARRRGSRQRLPVRPEHHRHRR